MRLTALALLLALPLPAAAETLSEEIGRSGIAATAARLSAQASLTAEERFALGGLQFLRAVEGSFQTRYAYGLTDRTGMLPFLRLPLEDNPAPKPFDPAVIAGIFRDASAELTRAHDTLAAGGEEDIGLILNLGDLWFDVNSDGQRQPEEALMRIAGQAILGQEGAGMGGAAAEGAAPVVRFDRADAAWLAAYANLLNGISEVVLAYDPTEPITRIFAARATMAQWGEAPPDWFTGGEQVPDSLDMIAMVLATANQTPDKDRMAAALAHFQGMIAENRRFWSLVGEETDNDREWLPNARQTSALGLALPPETAEVWGAVLDDAEALLAGKKLAPYWRVGASAGVNVGRIFTDPRPVDLPGWIQGWAALPYLETGPVVSADSWQRFEDLTSGQAMLMALWLN